MTQLIKQISKSVFQLSQIKKKTKKLWTKYLEKLTNLGTFNHI